MDTGGLNSLSIRKVLDLSVILGEQLFGLLCLLVIENSCPGNAYCAAFYPALTYILRNLLDEVLKKVSREINSYSRSVRWFFTKPGFRGNPS